MKVYVLTLVNTLKIEYGEYHTEVFANKEDAVKALKEWKRDEYQVLTQGNGRDVHIKCEDEGYVYMTWDDEVEWEIIEIKELEVK